MIKKKIFFYSMSVSLVISHFNSNEFLNLLNVIPSSWNVFIYNKSSNSSKFSNLLDKRNYHVLSLPNIGRETHTYLYHIIENYDNHSNFTIFIQDDTDNHIQDYKNFVSVIQKYIQDDTFFKSYPAKYRKGSPGSHLRHFHNGVFNGPPLQFPKDAVKTITDSLNINLIPRYAIYACAHFFCSNKCINRHSIDFYKKLLDYYLSQDDFNTSKKGYIFEHMWYTIFSIQ